MREPPANCDHSEVAGRLTSFRGCAWSHRMRAAAGTFKTCQLSLRMSVHRSEDDEIDSERTGNQIDRLHSLRSEITSVGCLF
jgi:hypothetical protein